MNKLVIHADQGRTKISRHIYGHFMEHLGRCVYEGFWVGEGSSIPNTRGFRNDVIDALKAINIPNLRWPGGCFADTYHWTDGIGPRKDRPSIINVHWGGCTESNEVGTHEFLDLCDLLSQPGRRCEPYICGNVGSGTVREMTEWLEYLTHPGPGPMAKLRQENGREQPWDLTYWAVGNENWGCGGNMRPQYYTDLFRQFASYCRHYGGKKLYRIACGHEEAWNDVFMEHGRWWADGLSVHYYTIPGDWKNKGSATDFTVDDWHTTLRKAGDIDGFIRRQLEVMDRHDEQKRVQLIIDEWGTWYDVEPGTNPGFLYQQNTMRDALVAGLSLNIMNSRADRIHMANIAQTVNVLQAMALTDGAKLILTPTYHVFELYKVHQDATLIPTALACGDYISGQSRIPQISASASRDARGRMHVSLVNLHHEAPAELAIDIRRGLAGTIEGRVLTAPAINGRNTFDEPAAVKPATFSDFRQSGSEIIATLPPRSVVILAM